MSYAERHRLTLVTDASGDVTGHTPAVTGRLIAIVYTKDTYDAGVDFAITAEATGEGIWTESDVNASATRAPRQPTHDNVGAASLYAGSGEPVEDYIVLAQDRVKIVVSSGGNVKSGQFDVIIG
ncbi:MAG: hypothetical protein IIA59_00615 [Candidatus Marinimicrobia bacterium]|nr:hypothetical protein [Candidatus Neomarinimicrobiota bacterium]